MLKTTKRVIKLPHGSQKSCDVPKAVPGLPNCTISFKYDNLSGVSTFCNHIANFIKIIKVFNFIKFLKFVVVATMHVLFEHFTL